MKRYSLLLLSIAISVFTAHAQLGQCNSPYSRFGLGMLCDQAQGFNKSMAGIGIGVRQGNVLNYNNPASYSSIDSLSMIIDAGMSLTMGNATQGNKAQNFRNAQLDYVSAGFRLRRGLGFSIGFMPFSRIGYQFKKNSIIANDPSQSLNITSTSTYYGEGGLHQVYAGLGWNPFAKLSVGVNAGLMWGNCNHSTTQTFEENGTTSTNFNSLIALHQAQLTTYNIEAGLQYPIRLTEQDWLTTGATITIGHSINSNATLARNAGSTTTPIDTIKAPFDVPFRYGVGLSWRHGLSWLVGADFRYEQWGNCRTPAWDKTSGEYVAEKGEYKDRFNVRLGAQYTPNPLKKNYFSRVQYRAGLLYSSPYLVINGQEGPHEYGVTIGAALPITNNYNSRSVVNVGFQWMRRSASGAGLISENYYMLTLGITFNEMWFMKYKIQ